MAKKKNTSKKTVKKAAKKPVKRPNKKPAKKTVKKSSGSGRPVGSTQFFTDKIAVKETTPLSRSNALEQHPGFRRLTLEASTPEYAILLESLAKIVKKSPDKLAGWIKRSK